MLAFAGTAAAGGGCDRSPKSSRPGPKQPADRYELAPFGDVTLLHFTDCHAQLLPVYFREPGVNLGVGDDAGKPPHLVGDALLKHFDVAPNTPDAHALACTDFEVLARRYGKVGGFAHLASLIKKVRDQRPGRTLLLDGGDTWQGSATALWTKGQDMVDAQKLLGVDLMTAHWEFTYGAERVRQIVERDFSGKIELLAQNVNDVTWGDPVFKPYALREINRVPVAVIGQAFPYTPIANPRYLIPDWSFGINDEHMQQIVDQVRAQGAQAVVLLSHNGMDVDLKLAGRVRGIDAILGGHTHDALPAPVIVSNGGGKTLVIGSGSHTKFLSVLDLAFKDGKVTGFRFRLLPIFANLIPADAEMAAYIEKVRAPFKNKLGEKLAVTESLLYRRGNFNGTFDQLIVEAMMAVLGTPIAFSPGFRWGATLLPGDAITMDDLMNQTAITYPTATVNELSGGQIKLILEDIADNLYHPDPYYRQGGDMVRVGGLKYTLDLTQRYGSRIADLEVRGQPLAANKIYKVAGWASVQPQPEGRRAIWDVVAEYLRDKKTVSVAHAYLPKLKGAEGNRGIAV